MTNVREVVGSTWMDIFHIDLSINCIVCLKRPKINEKETGFGPLKKSNLLARLKRDETIENSCQKVERTPTVGDCCPLERTIR